MAASTERDRFGFPELAGKTILIVEDHQDGLEFLVGIITYCGARVLAAPSTAHARMYLSAAVPSLIVCDFQMPRETGTHFMAWLRSEADPVLRAVPAMAVTAYLQDFQRDPAMRTFDSYFVKPLDVPRFLHTIGTILKRPATTHRRFVV